VLALAASRVAVSSPLVYSAGYTLAAAAIVLGREFVAGRDTHWWMWITYVELAAIAGIAMQRQTLLVARTRESTTEHARLAALEERRRIARDVHDILAHTLTILMVHVNSARLHVLDDPAGTAAVLDDVAQYGRQALDEIRRAVGLLSDPVPVDQSFGPIEAANAIEQLAATYRKAGIAVDLRLDVEMAHLSRLALAPDAVWSTGYRVVQESLANAAKHAAGVPVDVWIGVDDAGLHLVCANALEHDIVVLELPKGGNGLTGMRERIEAVHGSFAAGVEDERWVVRVDVPLQADTAARALPTLGRAS
jgi:signal transduction histidine kinase